jgi:recombination protein RecA
MKNSVQEKVYESIRAAGGVIWEPEPVRRKSTGILSLDIALGGGVPVSRLIVQYGAEGTGKTTMAMLIAKAYVERGERVMWLEVERSLDPTYADMLDLNLNETDEEGKPLIDIVKAATAEQWYELMRIGLESKYYHLIIIDSIAEMSPQSEKDATMDKGTMGLMPRTTARAIRVIADVLGDNDCTIWAINQERVDIGSYGAPTTYPGGKSLKHKAAVVIHMLRPKDSEDGDTLIFRWKFEKSKVFRLPPKKSDPFELRVLNTDGIRIDSSYEILFAARHFGLLTDKSGEPWKKRQAFYNGELLGDGEANILERLDQPSKLRDTLQEHVLQRIRGNNEADQEKEPGNGKHHRNDPESVSGTVTSATD